MMLIPTTPPDETVRHWLNHLHRCAYEAYAQAGSDGTAVQVYTTPAQNDGLVCLLTTARHTFIYIAFAPTVCAEALLPDLTEIVETAVAQRDNRQLDCTVYTPNETLVNFIRSYGFQECNVGYEFCYSANRPLPAVDLGPLRIRPFAATPIMPYLELLDLAFNQLKLPHDWRTTIFRRDIAGATRMLMEHNRNGDFAAFWKGERLVGLYCLNKNILETIAVHPEFQNHGYGTRILYHCMHRLLRESGYDDMYLYVASANTGAVRFYQRHGFVISAQYSQFAYC
ncbi:MAG: GNAT family N-acetyltransferase [Ardenticatenaceae bacterium]|nr:GNAT family N-acetyltransferase [Ardenticatenaceae bacterium]